MNNAKKEYLLLDCHAHIGKSNLLTRTTDVKSGVFTCDEAVKFMDAAGVTALCGFPTSNPHKDYKEENEHIIAGAKKYPDRIIPFARINPHYSETSVSDVTRYVSMGIRGIKFHPFLDGAYPANDKRLVHPIIHEAAKHNLLVIFHCGDAWNATPSLVADLAMDFPEVTFIVGHMGMYGFHMEALAFAKRVKNLYLDATELVPPYWVKAAVEAVGKERVLFGSDIPYIPYGHEIDKIMKWAGLDEASIEAILGLNLARLLNYKI